MFEFQTGADQNFQNQRTELEILARTWFAVQQGLKQKAFIGKNIFPLGMEIKYC